MKIDIPIISSKIKKPVSPSNLVKRNRLLEELDKGLFREDGQVFDRRLTLVSAPAGYGKTNLVENWLADRERVAWLFLDEGEDDPMRFWFYLVSALQKTEQGIGSASLSVLSSPPFALSEGDQSSFFGKEALTFLLNELFELEKPLLLVLDGYHYIQDERIHRGITFLVENMPSSFHLVLITRSDPPVALARWQIRGWMNQFRQNDLRFTPGEAEMYFKRIHHLDLSEEEVTSLVKRTEGWVSGLQIAAISLAEKEPGDKEEFIRNLSGNQRYLGEYLTGEIVNRQSPCLQEFLYKTSILPFLSPSLCREVSGREDSGELLKELENLNLFISRQEDKGYWYRYHSLFKELLQYCLQENWGKEVPDLHNRASRWFEKNGYIPLAIEHALKAGNFTQAVRLMDGHAENLFNSGEQKNLFKWTKEIPGEYLQEHPQLRIFESMILYLSGKIREAKEIMDDVRIYLEGHGQLSEEFSSQERDNIKPELKGMYFAMQSFLHLFSGEYTGMAENSRLALKLLPEHKTLWRSGVSIISGDVWAISGELNSAEDAYMQALATCQRSEDHYFTLMAGFKLLRVWFYQGKFTEAERLCRELLKEAEVSGFAKTARAGSIMVLQGMIACERNQLEEALNYAKTGLSLIEKNNYMMLGWANACLSRVYLTRGELDAAAECLDRTENYGRVGEIPYVENLAATGKARLWLIRGKKDPIWIEEAYQLLMKRLPFTGDEKVSNREDKVEQIQFFRLDEYQALVRVLLARGHGDKAEQILRQLEAIANNGGAFYLAMEARLLLALARVSGKEDGEKEEKEALEILRQAFHEAGPRAREEGWVRIFVDEGPPLARLLYHAAEEDISPEFIGSLLAQFPAESIPGSQEGLVEPLSKRELEILQLIADGLSNQDIASRLYLSLNTVKWHVKNIYGKLGVGNRVASLARARSLNLVR